jgi:hypothetical protein
MQERKPVDIMRSIQAEASWSGRFGDVDVDVQTDVNRVSGAIKAQAEQEVREIFEGKAQIIEQEQQ